MKLHLGVADLPYANAEGMTTGEVAEMLEAHYDIIQTFYDRHEGDIATMMCDAMAGALENKLSGAPPRGDPMAGAMSRVEELFRRFLSEREVEQPARGVRPYTIPTMAAVLGVSHRFKGKVGHGRRPSFIDTGLYQSSFRSWVTND